VACSSVGPTATVSVGILAWTPDKTVAELGIRIPDTSSLQNERGFIIERNRKTTLIIYF
jgi:hypothetical protein